MGGEERRLKGETCVEEAKRLREEEFSLEMKAKGVVLEIISRVKREGDRALIEITRVLDGVDISEGFFLDRNYLEKAFNIVSNRFREAILNFRDRVYRFHKKQVERSWFDTSDDVIYGMMVVPMDRVGVYVPGGKASYPSTAIMAAVPARIAGVKEVYGFTPPIPTNEVLAAFYVAGVDGVYTIGGAQAIAAACFGTETVKRVDKIVGPGNIYVNLAKKELFGLVGIDTLAGPSEVLIISDGSADSRLVARDLLAQLEHDEMAKAILLTTSQEEAELVPQIVGKAVDLSERREILSRSHENLRIYLVDTVKDAVLFSNAYGPEHLEIFVRNPFLVMSNIRCAGAVFLGPLTTTAFGDYGIGPNHILPTGGAARFSSPLGVYDFYRRISFVRIGEDAFGRMKEDVKLLAEMEGLLEHKKSVEERE